MFTSFNINRPLGIRQKVLGQLIYPAVIALGLTEDVKLWALISTGKITGSKQTIVGIQASFEV